MESEKTNENISLMHDGQLEPDQLASLTKTVSADLDLRRRLHRYALMGECLRGSPIHVSEQFSQAIMARLESEPPIDPSTPIDLAATGFDSTHRNAPNPATGSRYRWGLATAAVFLFGIVIGGLLVPGAGDYRTNRTLADDGARASQGNSELVVVPLRHLSDELEPLVAAHGQVTFGRHAGTGFLPYAPQLVLEREPDNRGQQ